MSVEILENYFGIKPEQIMNDGDVVRYIENNSLYTIAQVTHMEQEALIELYEMSDHMAKHGDQKVSTFVPSENGKFLITHKEQDYILLHNHYTPQHSQHKNIGRTLARFHGRGMQLQAPISEYSRVGQWKEYWIKRLEQMESVWSSMIYEQPRDSFDKLFIQSFPYYLGLCENAIQYVTDTDLDEELSFTDRGTICNQRFEDGMWKSSVVIKSPFDWVFDHPSRDISEWIRDCYFRNTRSFEPEMIRFLQDYESIMPISPFSWRLIYARLLFPLHYFSCVEDYFISTSEWTKKQLEEKLTRYIRDVKEHELFLGNFYKIAGLQQRNFPEVEWLS